MKNQPAFPTPLHSGGGMTLRDYFAAKAMQTMLTQGLDDELTAKYSYEMADAMMKAREA